MRAIRRVSLIAGSMAVLLGACATEEPLREATPPPDGTPKLVLFIVVDQLRADYLERFRPLLTGGFDRLLEESLVFTEASHEHAVTHTAPGHATLVTGAYPSRHGVVSNHWYDRETRAEVASDDDDRWNEDHSPHRLLVPTLADHIKARWPGSKSFAASGKSRGATFSAGLNGDRAFWYDDETGRFVTSTYYGDTQPTWLDAFHLTALPDRLFGTAWEPLPEIADLAPEYDIEPLDRGPQASQFPHAVGSGVTTPGEGYYWAFYRTPFTDRYLLELAEELIESEELGSDPFPDWLGLSFSALDIVGHSYGPNSPELLDTLLRLDRVLGELLDLVDRTVGLEHTLISLSADHGVTAVPEVLRSRGLAARRFGTEERLCFQALDRHLDEAHGPAEWFEFDRVLDPLAAEATGVPVAEAIATARKGLESCPGVARVWTAEDWAEGAPDTGDPMRALYRNAYYSGRSPDLLVQLEPATIDTSSTTTHGSPYPYDTRVPWLLRLPSGDALRIDTPVSTADVAPTIAELLGLQLGAEIDGKNAAPPGVD